MKKNLSKIMAFVALFAATILPGCRKDSATFEEYLPTLGDIQTKVLKQVPTTNGTTVFSFLANSTDTTLATNSGIRLILNDLQNIFVDSTGKIITPADCPDLKITLVEAVSRGEQIAHNLSATSGGKLLKPAGFVKIEIKCGDQILKILPGRNFKINFPVANPDDRKSDLKLFAGATAGQNVVDWTTENQEIYLSDWQSNGSQIFGYELLTDQTGWLGAAKLNDDATTNFCITLPAAHNNQNTVVWMWISKTNSLVKMEGAGVAGHFCFENAPVGFPIKIAVVSKIGADWKFVQLDTEVGNDALISLSPILFSEVEIIEKLRFF